MSRVLQALLGERRSGPDPAVQAAQLSRASTLKAAKIALAGAIVGPLILVSGNVYLAEQQQERDDTRQARTEQREEDRTEQQREEEQDRRDFERAQDELARLADISCVDALSEAHDLAEADPMLVRELFADGHEAWMFSRAERAACPTIEDELDEIEESLATAPVMPTPP